MMWKKDLRRKLAEKANRIRELEERICPTQSHEWVKTGAVFAPCSVGDDSMRYTWQCRKCGKQMSTVELDPTCGTVIKR